MSDEDDDEVGRLMPTMALTPTTGRSKRSFSFDSVDVLSPRKTPALPVFETSQSQHSSSQRLNKMKPGPIVTATTSESTGRNTPPAYIGKSTPHTAEQELKLPIPGSAMRSLTPRPRPGLARSTLELPSSAVSTSLSPITPSAASTRREHTSRFRFEPGALVGGRFTVGACIGAGAFGEIFEGVSTDGSTERVAIKVVVIKVFVHQEPMPAKIPQLAHEFKLYTVMQGKVGIPVVHWYGHDTKASYLVMDLLGKSLEDLFEQCQRRFTLKTVLQLADQMLELIEHVHTRDFIHRDIKPDNFMMGLEGNRTDRLVYLIDFGLAHRFRDTTTHSHIAQREGVSMVGTARYASINAHLGVEQSRRDDLEAIGYLLIYFLEGSLPWQGLKSNNPKKDKHNMIREKKLGTAIEILCRRIPRQFCEYLDYCRTLGFDVKPNYRYLKSLFSNLFTASGFAYDGCFDWNTPPPLTLKTGPANQRRIVEERIQKSPRPPHMSSRSPELKKQTIRSTSLSAIVPPVSVSIAAADTRDPPAHVPISKPLRSLSPGAMLNAMHQASTLSVIKSDGNLLKQSPHEPSHPKPKSYASGTSLTAISAVGVSVGRVAAIICSAGPNTLRQRLSASALLQEASHAASLRKDSTAFRNTGPSPTTVIDVKNRNAICPVDVVATPIPSVILQVIPGTPTLGTTDAAIALGSAPVKLAKSSKAIGTPVNTLSSLKKRSKLSSLSLQHSRTQQQDVSVSSELPSSGVALEIEAPEISVTHFRNHTESADPLGSLEPAEDVCLSAELFVPILITTSNLSSLPSTRYAPKQCLPLLQQLSLDITDVSAASIQADPDCRSFGPLHNDSHVNETIDSVLYSPPPMHHVASGTNATTHPLIGIGGLSSIAMQQTVSTLGDAFPECNDEAGSVDVGFSLAAFSNSADLFPDMGRWDLAVDSNTNTLWNSFTVIDGQAFAELTDKLNLGEIDANTSAMCRNEQFSFDFS